MTCRCGASIYRSPKAEKDFNDTSMLDRYSGCNEFSFNYHCRTELPKHYVPHEDVSA